MAPTILTCPFRALLSDLADLEPRHGFQLPADVTLSNEQLATVCEHDGATDGMLDAFVTVLPAIAAQLRIADRHPIAYDGIAALVINALKSAAQRTILRELVSYCDDRRTADADDRAYEARRSRPGSAAAYLQGGL